MVAKHDSESLWVEFAQAFLELSQGNEPRALKMTDLCFVRLSHINDFHCTAGLQPGSEVLNGGVEG
jgi:hypothetical protein